MAREILQKAGLALRASRARGSETAPYLKLVLALDHFWPHQKRGGIGGNLDFIFASDFFPL